MMLAGRWRARARRVLALLERERALIRAGDAAGLAAHASRTASALDDLGASPPPDDPDALEELRAIRAAAERNRRLLTAMAEGARSAHRDLERLAQARRTLGYDSSGAAIGTGLSPRSDRRA